MAPPRKNLKVEYYTLSEEEMQALLNKARNDKDQRSQAELLKIFHNFLSKYVTLLYHGRYNINDLDIRRFLGLFVKDYAVRYHLISNKLNPMGAKHVAEILHGIQFMVQRLGTEEDVTQTVSMAFLQCISRYEQKDSIPFSGFLYSYFFYVLKKQVDTFLIDQLGRKTFPLIGDEEFSDEDEITTPGFTAPPLPAAEDLIYSEEIDEDWIAGDTAHRPFDILNMQERQLLKWRYIDGQRSSQIGLRVSEHQNTIREKLNKIREKLAEAVAADLADLESC